MKNLCLSTPNSYVDESGLMQELLRMTRNTSTGRTLVAEAERYYAEGSALPTL